MSRILVIDDDPTMTQLSKAYFTSKGHSVVIARNGKEGLQKFKNQPFDIVITDLMMPGVHGFQVIDAIKKSKVGPKTPIILLTADQNEPELDKYERRAFQDDTLTKPFDMPVLEKMVNSLFAEFKDREL